MDDDEFNHAALVGVLCAVVGLVGCLVAPVTWVERWERMDPMLVLERRQEQAARSKPAKAEKAAQALEALFEGENMARRLDIPPHITAALYQWGKWADRPQFWANLNTTPAAKVLGIGSSNEQPDFKLDPQSLKIHKALLRMKCRVTKMVLVGYYVGNMNWDDQQVLFQEYGVSRTGFYEILKRGSLATYNAAKLVESTI